MDLKAGGSLLLLCLSLAFVPRDSFSVTVPAALKQQVNCAGMVFALAKSQQKASQNLNLLLKPRKALLLLKVSKDFRKIARQYLDRFPGTRGISPEDPADLLIEVKARSLSAIH